MKISYFFYILCMILLGLSAVLPISFAVEAQAASFTGQTNPFNITFVGNATQNYILPIPLYAYIKNITLEFELFNYFKDNFDREDTTSGILGNEWQVINNSNIIKIQNNKSNFTNLDCTSGLAYHYLNDTQPSQIDITLSSNNLHSDGYSFDLINGLDSAANRVIRVAIIEGGRTLGVYNGSGGSGWHPLVYFANNSDYNVSIRSLDYTNHIYDFYINNTLISKNETFYKNQNYITNISFHTELCVDGTQVFYDNLAVYYNNFNFLIGNYTYNVMPSMFDQTNRLIYPLNNTLLNNLQSNLQIINFTYVPLGNNSPFQITLINSTYAYGIDTCGNSFNIPNSSKMINFTGAYENNLTLTNIDILTGSYLTYNLHGLTSTSTDYPTVINTPNLTYCGYPSWGQFDVSYLMNYQKTGTTTVRQRSSSNVLINNILSTIPLYVLDSSNTIQARIRVQDAYSNPISGATVTITRTIAGIPYTVSSSSTDSSGMAYINLDSTIQYTFQASKTGYTTSDALVITPTNTDIYTLTLGASSSQTISYQTGVDYIFSPSNFNYLVNNTAYNFYFNLSSSYWQITTCGISLKDVDGNTVATSAGTFNSSFCSAVVTYTTPNISTTLTSFGSYTLNTTLLSQSYQYRVSNLTSEDYTIKTVINDINNFSGAGFDWRARMFLAICIVIGVTAYASFKFNSLINPEAAMIIQFALVFLITLFGWFTIPASVHTFPSIFGYNMGQSAILILDFFVTAAFFLWRLS